MLSCLSLHLKLQAYSSLANIVMCVLVFPSARKNGPFYSPGKGGETPMAYRVVPV